MQNIGSHRAPAPLIPMQSRRQICQPLCKRDMDPLRAGSQNRSIRFRIVVLEDFSDHAVHDLAELCLLHEGADKGEIVLVFGGCGVVLDVVVEKGVPVWRVGETDGLVDIGFGGVESGRAAEVEG